MQRTHYLIWRRGFAPILFILAIALIVASIGSGIYFATKKSAPTPARERQIPNNLIEATTTNVVVIPTTTPTVAGVKIKPSTQQAIAYDNCGSSAKTAGCLAERIKTCSPAKGIVVDPASGLKVERIIDGYRGTNCSYRSNIISGTGNMAMLNGMDINCMIPRATLAVTLQGGSMSKEDMLALCTGTFIDLMRTQTGATQ